LRKALSTFLKSPPDFLPLSHEAIEISNLSKSYGKIKALKKLSLEVPGGMIYGLAGTNGSGKTTLIKSIVGSLRPDSGTIKVLGLDPLRDKRAVRKQVGYMPQSPALYDDLPARNNILFFGKAQDVNDPEQKTVEILSGHIPGLLVPASLSLKETE
jgi:ABC-2 type transport system ATP-binding protein